MALQVYVVRQIIERVLNTGRPEVINGVPSEENNVIVTINIPVERISTSAFHDKTVYVPASMFSCDSGRARSTRKSYACEVYNENLSWESNLISARGNPLGSL